MFCRQPNNSILAARVSPAVTIRAGPRRQGAGRHGGTAIEHHHRPVLIGSRGDVAASSICSTTGVRSWQNQSIGFPARMASAGGGVRMRVTSYVEVDFEARPVSTKRPPPARQSDMNGIGLFWRVVGRF